MILYILLILGWVLLIVSNIMWIKRINEINKNWEFLVNQSNEDWLEMFYGSMSIEDE